MKDTSIAKATVAKPGSAKPASAKPASSKASAKSGSAKASGAKTSAKSGAKADLLRREIEHIDITSFDARPIVESMADMSFTSRDLAAAAEIFNAMLKDVGLKPEDVTYIAVGAPNTTYMALTVSKQIDALYELAFKEKVFAAMAELQWFITEQVAEEKTVREIVAKFHMVKDDPASILDVDRELGGRAPEDEAGGGHGHGRDKS